MPGTASLRALEARQVGDVTPLRRSPEVRIPPTSGAELAALRTEELLAQHRGGVGAAHGRAAPTLELFGARRCRAVLVHQQSPATLLHCRPPYYRPTAAHGRGYPFARVGLRHPKM